MSIASVTDRIQAIQSQMQQLASLGQADAASAAAFGTQLGTALSGTDASGLTAGAVDRSAAVAGTDTGAGTGTGDPGALQQQVIRTAESAVGVPYLWGGNSLTHGIDCSGLVQQAYKSIGVQLPRLSADQARSGTAVPSLADAQPGDLLAWDNSSRNNGADHIAIYLGDGKMIEAPHTGAQVRIVDVPSTPDYIRRIIGSAAGTATTGSVAGLPAAALTAPATAGKETLAQARSAFDLQALFSGISR